LKDSKDFPEEVASEDDKERPLTAAPSAGGIGSLARQTAAPALEAAPPPAQPSEAALAELESVRRARVLKAHTSNSGSDCNPEERGSTTLDSIITKVDLCVGKGAFWCADKTSSNSVFFLTHHVADALPDKVDTPDEANALVKKEFPKVLVKVLLDNDTYDVLAKFLDLFTKLDKKGCHAPKIRECLIRLAKYETTSDQELDLSGIDLESRMRLIDSRLYKGFENIRAKELLTKSRTQFGDAREKTLRILQSASGNLSLTFQETVKDLLYLYGCEVELESKVAWVLQKPIRIGLSAGFDLENRDDWDYAYLRVFVAPPPAWPVDIKDTAFWKLCDLVVRGGGRPLVKNPVIASFLDLSVNFNKIFGAADRSWATTVLTNAGASKLGVPGWINQVDIHGIPEEGFKTCMKLLSPIFPSPEPEWLSGLKKSYRASIKQKDPALLALEAEVDTYQKELDVANELLAISPDDEQLKDEMETAAFNLHEATSNYSVAAAAAAADDPPPKKKSRAEKLAKAGDTAATAGASPAAMAGAEEAEQGEAAGDDTEAGGSPEAKAATAEAKAALVPAKAAAKAKKHLAAKPKGTKASRPRPDPGPTPARPRPDPGPCPAPALPRHRPGPAKNIRGREASASGVRGGRLCALLGNET